MHISTIAVGDISQEARSFLEQHGATIEGAGGLDIIGFPSGTKATRETSYWDYTIELPGIEEREGDNEEWFTPIITVELSIDTSETKLNLSKM